MKLLFYLLAAAAAFVALLSFVRGIENYLSNGSFVLVQFGVGIVGVLLAGIWVKRARSMQ